MIYIVSWLATVPILFCQPSASCSFNISINSLQCTFELLQHKIQSHLFKTSSHINMFSSRKDNDSNPNTNTNYNDSNASSYGAGSGSSGRPPHKSSLLNKLDPRVDSSIGHQTSATGRNDGGALVTSPRHDNSGFGISNTGHGDTSGYGTGSAISGRNTGATSAGPHDSSLANKVCSIYPRERHQAVPR